MLIIDLKEAKQQQFIMRYLELVPAMFDAFRRISAVRAARSVTLREVTERLCGGQSPNATQAL